MLPRSGPLLSRPPKAASIGRSALRRPALVRVLHATRWAFIAALFGVPARAQVDLSSLEAAYIFNFAQFTEWPAAAIRGPNLVLCVNPRAEIGAALAKLDGRPVGKRTLAVRALPDTTSVAACGMLVVDDSSSAAAALKTAQATDLPLLIVRTADGGEGPSVIALFRDGDRLRFDIDNKEATRRHLGLSSKLLRLARNVS